MVDISIDYDPKSSTYQDVLFKNNDLVLTADANAADGTDPVLQSVIQNIKFIAAEWFLDNTQGVPWFQEIFVKNPDQDKVDSLLLAAIANTPGIVAVTYYKFTVNKAARGINVAFRAQKTTGIISYAGLVAF